MTQAPLRLPGSGAPGGDVVARTGTGAGTRDFAPAPVPASTPVTAPAPVPAWPPVAGSTPDPAWQPDPASTPDHGAPAQHARERDPTSGSRLPWVVALVLYSAVVAAVVGWPSPVDTGARDALTAFLARLHEAGVPDRVDHSFVERAANVAMFVPLGLMVTRVTRRWWWGLLVPAGLSCAAELGQHELRPERVATWTDVGANTTGAALGVVLALLLVPRRPRRRSRGSAGG